MQIIAWHEFYGSVKRWYTAEFNNIKDKQSQLKRLLICKFHLVAGCIKSA